MRVRWLGSAFLLTALGLFAGGCGEGGKKPVKVSGVLKFKDGTPIAKAMVQFEPKDPDGRMAYGVTESDGSFHLTTFNTGDGAFPGEYTVVVTKGSETAAAETSVQADAKSGKDCATSFNSTATSRQCSVSKKHDRFRKERKLFFLT